jgi:hypothetical protein
VSPMPQIPGLSRGRLLGAAAAGIAGLALASCARGTQSRPLPGDLLFVFTDTPTYAPGLAAASAQLRKVAGYGLSPQAAPNVRNYQQIIRMSAQTDSTTDMIKWWNGYRVVDIAHAGILADVPSAWYKAAANGWSEDKELRDAFTYDGKQYGMPLYKSYYAVFYSKRVTVPKEIAKSAQLDGAGWLRMFASIHLPLARSALLAVFIFQFTWIWNGQLFGITLSLSPNVRPVMATLADLNGQYSTVGPPVVLAGALVASVRPVVLFFVFQRFFVNSLKLTS